MNKDEAFRAMIHGHKVANVNFTDDEYLHIKGGIILSEDGYDFRDWFHNPKKGEEWKNDGWSIVKICYECGKRIYPQDEVTLDDLNYAHQDCLRG